MADENWPRLLALTSTHTTPGDDASGTGSRAAITLIHAITA
jgi:hypothetical protein